MRNGIGHRSATRLPIRAGLEHHSVYERGKYKKNLAVRENRTELLMYPAQIMVAIQKMLTPDNIIHKCTLDTIQPPTEETV